MKKLTLIFTVVMLAIVAVFGVTLTACTDGADLLEYTVTVLGEDEVTAVENVTVKWSDSSTKGTAKTNADGKATASLPAATYEVTLSDLPEGLTCAPATVTSAARGITLVLEKAEVEYSVTVTKQDSTAASGVTVTWWTADNTSIATQITDDDGKAAAKLVYGEYTVTLSTLPAGFIYGGSQKVTGAQPSAAFTLESGDTVTYSVSVKSEGGLIFKQYTVSAYNGEELAASEATDDEGVATLVLPEANGYTLRVQNLPAGYRQDEVTLSKDNLTVDVTLYSEVIDSAPESNTRYLVGDIIHNYEFTTPYTVDGSTLEYSIAKLLEEKDAVVLNFWGTNCSACIQEMPAMQQAYEAYSDRVEFLAVSNYMGGDSNTTIINYRNDSGYTFPMFRDSYSFSSKFALKGWPTTVVIDRYGAITRIEEGALTSVTFWQKILDAVVGDDYVQSFVPGIDRNEPIVVEIAKPDVTVSADHYDKVASAINGADMPDGCSIVWYGEPEETAEYTWPFVLGNAEGGSEIVLYPSNTKHDSTFSFIYADVEMTAGKVFTFDYWAQTEIDNDIFYVLWDGKVVYSISGENSDWKTCYVFAELVNGKHNLALSYIKSNERGAGFDNVYIKNARFIDVNEIEGTLNMLRGAAYGIPENGASEFLHYADVEKGADGYYYVDASKLSGAQYAGNDGHPMLFANLSQATNWSATSVSQMVYEVDEESGEYVYDCNFEFRGKTEDWRKLLTEYVILSGKSDITGCLPVNDKLRELLIAFTAHVSGKDSHDNEWLELCYFYSHYGSGEPYGNPIIGLTEETAIEITEGKTVTADLTKPIPPFPITIYAFRPEQSGVYKFESFISEDLAADYAAQVWIYTDDIDNPLIYNGDDRLHRGGKNEQNFLSYIYLKKGETYYVAVALLMAETGTYDFSVSYYGESITILDCCASGDYTLTESGEMKLRDAVKYGKDKDGYYHVLKEDGTLGDFIYMDFKYSSKGHIYYSLSEIINQYVMDPVNFSKKLFKVFDFTKAVSYYVTGYTEDGSEIYSYDVIDLTRMEDAKYKDYTDRMKELCEEAMKNDGLLKVTDELVDIMSLYFPLRTDAIYEDIIAAPRENEWLKFCYYYKTIDENNPV